MVEPTTLVRRRQVEMFGVRDITDVVFQWHRNGVVWCTPEAFAHLWTLSAPACKHEDGYSYTAGAGRSILVPGQLLTWELEGTTFIIRPFLGRPPAERTP